jgi:hypothetical protein
MLSSAHFSELWLRNFHIIRVLVPERLAKSDFIVSATTAIIIIIPKKAQSDPRSPHYNLPHKETQSSPPQLQVELFQH